MKLPQINQKRAAGVRLYSQSPARPPPSKPTADPVCRNAVAVNPASARVRWYRSYKNVGSHVYISHARHEYAGKERHSQRKVGTRNGDMPPWCADRVQERSGAALYLRRKKAA